MVDWNDPQIKLIVYLVYGTSFILMFLVITLWKRRVAHIEFINSFRYLAAFGILHGLGEYSDIPRFLAWQPTWLFDIIKLILVSSSFATLLFFGLNLITIDMIESRWWIRGLPYGALMMYFWMLIAIGIDFTNKGIGINYNTAELAVRYTLGFLGAAISSYSFLRLSGKIKGVGNAGEADVGEADVGEILFLVGIFFGLYAIFGGLIVNDFMGMPVVFFRSAIAVFITVSVIDTLRLFRIKET